MFPSAAYAQVVHSRHARTAHEHTRTTCAQSAHTLGYGTATALLPRHCTVVTNAQVMQPLQLCKGSAQEYKQPAFCTFRPTHVATHAAPASSPTFVHTHPPVDARKA
jgi:hypothetical protein